MPRKPRVDWNAQCEERMPPCDAVAFLPADGLWPAGAPRCQELLRYATHTEREPWHRAVGLVRHPEYAIEVVVIWQGGAVQMLDWRAHRKPTGGV